jgi:hypothetical protein
MNERIKELSKHSWEAVDFGKPLPIEQFEQKFAESIVRECANLLPADMTHGLDGRPLLQVFKEHFGVEG